jgi:predicted metal-dependent phosphoesterase TrpH
VLKVDLHLHTSEDPRDHIHYSAADVIDRAAGLGFHAIAVTLHDQQLETDRLRARARERGITLTPGVERTIRGRHVLLLNFPAGRSMAVSSFADLANAKRHTGGLVVAPHPLFPGRSCLGAELDTYTDLFDAVEWSYFWTRAIDYNTGAARWAEAHGKPLVGNSDAHDIRQLGRTFSLVDAPNDPDAICAAIREGRVECQSTPVPYPELVQVFGGLMVRGWINEHRRRPLSGGIAREVPV